MIPIDCCVILTARPFTESSIDPSSATAARLFAEGMWLKSEYHAGRKAQPKLASFVMGLCEQNHQKKGSDRPRTRALRLGPKFPFIAVACKLEAAVWHVLTGHVIGALEPIERLRAKLFKLATEIGVSAIKAAGHESKEAFIGRKLYILKS